MMRKLKKKRFIEGKWETKYVSSPVEKLDHIIDSLEEEEKYTPQPEIPEFRRMIS